MKMKSFLPICMAFSIIFGSTLSFGADTMPRGIPNTFTPNTVIKYNENGELAILSNDKAMRSLVKEVPYSPLDISAMSKKELMQYKYEQNLVKRLKKEVSNLPVTYVKNPSPIPGTIVTYDAEGFISDIKMPITTKSALPRGTRKTAGTYTWGANNNTLVIGSSSVTGNGRFTVFTDKIGEADNTLKKGDVATRQDYDNPKYGQEIATRRLNNDMTDTNYTATMYKRDNGSLPDAILDIWKTGVENYGLTYSSTLSFKGRYYYSF